MSDILHVLEPQIEARVYNVVTQVQCEVVPQLSPGYSVVDILSNEFLELVVSEFRAQQHTPSHVVGGEELKLFVDVVVACNIKLLFTDHKQVIEGTGVEKVDDSI